MIDMTKIILIRHGQTTGNKQGKLYGNTNIQLSAEGIKQAKLLAQNFPVCRIDSLYASDLSRAYDTALYVSKRFCCDIIINKNLREMNFGEWEGLTYQEIACRWPKEAEIYISKPDKLQIPGGETFIVLQQRALRTIYRIIEDNKNKTAVVITHGAFIAALLTAVMHMPLRNICLLQQANTSVNILLYKNDHWQIELINGTAHLGM